MNYNRNNPKDKFPKESVYYHFRYSVVDTEQDAQQITKITTCQDLEYYVISTIENEESDEKTDHRHVTLKFKVKKTHSSAKKLIVSDYKYSKNQIYFQPKYKNSSIEELIRYTLKTGLHKSNAELYLLEEAQLPLTELEELKKKTKVDEATKSKELCILRMKKIREGDLSYFWDHDPKYLGNPEFNRLLVWSQKDATEDVLNPKNIIVQDEKTGTGKSSGVFFITDPNARFVKLKTRDTIDGWNNHRHYIFIIDELDTPEALESIGGLEGLKNLGDYSPLTGKFMYVNRDLKYRPQFIFITMNTTIGQLISHNKYGKPRRDIEAQKKTIARRFLIVDTKEFHKLFGIRLDQDINRIVFDFKGMQEQQYQPNFDYYEGNEYLQDKYEKHLDYWLEHGEQKYIAWQRKEQGIDEKLARLKKVNDKMRNINSKLLAFGPAKQMMIDTDRDIDTVGRKIINEDDLEKKQEVFNGLKLNALHFK